MCFESHNLMIIIILNNDSCHLLGNLIIVELLESIDFLSPIDLFQLNLHH